MTIVTQIVDPLEALRAAARADLAALSYPDRPWLPETTTPDGAPVLDALIVGGGQSGIFIAAALRREGVHKVAVLDRAAKGEEGPWLTYARMAELRTPKVINGNEFGIPNLSLRRWYQTAYGVEAWDAIERVPRTAWKAYLDWYAETVGVAIENGVAVVDVRPGPGGAIAVETETAGRSEIRYARAVVLATGFDAVGAWKVPDFISASLPPELYDHSNVPIDFSRHVGKRIGVLGNGASAFDTANAALAAGAASAEVSFRRARLPRSNPHPYLETGGTMVHFPFLSDATRWQIARFFRTADQPPPVRAFTTAMAHPHFRLRPATPWTAVSLAPTGAIDVETPHGRLQYDHLILATGSVVDFALRPELSTLQDRVVLWRDRYQPPAGDEDPRLGALPYLDDGYAFEPRAPQDDWLRHIFAFSALSMVSHGPHSTSISGNRTGLPRLVRGVTRRLRLDTEADLVPGLYAYAAPDLPVADDLEAELIAGFANSI